MGVKRETRAPDMAPVEACPKALPHTPHTKSNCEWAKLHVMRLLGWAGTRQESSDPASFPAFPQVCAIRLGIVPLAEDA